MPEDTLIHYYQGGKSYCGAPVTPDHDCAQNMKNWPGETVEEKIRLYIAEGELMFCIECGRDRCHDC